MQRILGGFVGWLRRSQMRRAAKQYARRLGPHLRRAYGASEHYKAPQIRASVTRLGLNSRFIAIGYAAFLLEEDFAFLASDMPVYIPYREARNLFERFRPPALFSASGNPETSIKTEGVGYSDH